MILQFAGLKNTDNKNLYTKLRLVILLYSLLLFFSIFLSFWFSFLKVISTSVINMDIWVWAAKVIFTWRWIHIQGETWILKPGLLTVGRPRMTALYWLDSFFFLNHHIWKYFNVICVLFIYLVYCFFSFCLFVCLFLPVCVFMFHFILFCFT